MKVNKKLIGLIIGLVCVVICVALMLRMCGSDPNGEIGETNQTEESTSQTETTEATVQTTETTEPTTEATEETTEATEETTEATEETTEPTEESTDPTMETVISAPPPSTNNAIGSPGSVGRPEDETTAPTEPEEEVIVPAGQEKNPYVEILGEYPSGFETVMIPADSTVAYALFVHNGAELLIEDADAYVIHNGETIESVDGLVKVILTAGENAPAVFQLGNKSAGSKAFTLSIKDALGEPTNPEVVEKIDELKVKLEEDDKTGYTFRWTALEEGNVSFSVGSITENVDCNIILTVGELSVPLVQPQQDEESESTEPSEEPETTEATQPAQTEGAVEAAEETEETAPAESTEATESTEHTQPTEPGEDKPSVTIGVSQGDELTIQVITLLPEKEEAEQEETKPTEPVEEKLPAAEITVNGVFTAGVNEDKEDQETQPTEPEESTDPTEETEPGESTEPSESTDPSEPEETTKPSEGPEAEAYTVTVTDYNGNPKTGVAVKFVKDGTPAALVTVNEKGMASMAYDGGEYQVELLMPKGEELYYEEKNAVVNKTAASITLKVAPALSGAAQEYYFDSETYEVGVGGTYIKTQANVVNYYLFVPTTSGAYRITTSDPQAKVSYWGASTAFVSDITDSTDYKDNAFTCNVKENNLGATYVIGITGAEDCILEITRIGDPILDETDFPITVYEGTKEVTKYNDLPSGKSKQYVNLSAETDSIKLVLGSDGYYHVGTADGPLMYMDLSSAAPYVPLYGMMGMAPIGGENIVQHFYDDNGTLIRREQYNTLLKEYASNVDKTYGVYPLTEDLKYMIQQAGARKGWWDAENPNYMFKEVSNLNTEIAWMFALCTIE